MVCIYCNGKTQVINSRAQKRSNQIWRRRSCLECNAIFTTIEAIDASQALSVLYPDESLRPFSRDMLLLSIYDSMRHRKSPSAEATELVFTIWKLLMPHIKDGTIPRSTIISVTGKVLDRFDKPAGVHYKAFHPL